MPKINKAGLDRIIDFHDNNEWSKEAVELIDKTFGTSVSFYGIDCILTGVELINHKRTHKRNAYYEVFKALGYEITEEN